MSIATPIKRKKPSINSVTTASNINMLTGEYIMSDTESLINDDSPKKKKYISCFQTDEKSSTNSEVESPEENEYISNNGDTVRVDSELIREMGELSKSATICINRNMIDRLYGKYVAAKSLNAERQIPKPFPKVIYLIVEESD